MAKFIEYFKELFRNKRKHERYPLCALARVQVSGSKEPSLSCLIQSISESGIGVYSYCVLEEGISVSVEIQFTSVEGKRVSDTVEGCVISLTEEGASYCIGVAFNEILSPDKQPNLFTQLHEFTEQK